MLTDKELLLEDEDDGRKFEAELRKVVSAKGRERKFVVSKKSDAAQALLTHKRKPLRFDRHKFFIPVYDLSSKMMLLKCARQTAKSSTLCNLILIESISYDAFRTLYVSPSSMQTRQFSNEKLTPTINDTPIIQKFYQDKRCIQQVYEKTFTNASHLFLRYAFLTADRCLPGDVRIQLADGRCVPIVELFEKGENVELVSCRENGKPSISKGISIRRTGTKKIAKITTTFPIPLRVSYDDQVKTQDGWKDVADIQPGDFIAAPHCGDILDERPIGEDMAWLIGAMISEGSCADKKEVSFANTEFEFVEEFEERAQRVGIKLGHVLVDSRYEKECFSIALYSSERGAGICGGKKDLWDLGEFGERSHEKHIPEAIFRATRDEKISFLSSIFRGDGWLCLDNNHTRAGYSSASKRLVEDLALLLWSFGVRTSIYKKPPQRKWRREHYVLGISTVESIKLIEVIGNFNNCQIRKPKKASNYHDRIPVSYDALKKYIKNHHGLSTHAAWTEHRIQLRPGNRKDSVGRAVLLKIAEKLNDDFLANFAHKSCSWVEVKSVEEDGIEDVFDLTVPGDECFVANGHVVHNCRGIPSDRLCIDEMQDILSDNIKVIAECLSFSKFQYELYSGTPKSHDNAIEEYWGLSNQLEWVVPCDNHVPRHYNILGTENIGKKHLICDKCGNRIFPESGQWVVTNPGGEYTGFHVTQLMVPWKQGEEEWKKQIIFKYENWPDATFHNEVLGVSYDQASKPITQTEIIQCCYPINKQVHVPSEHLIMEPNMDVLRRPNYAGVDWGEGRGEGKVEGGKKRHASWTVLTIGTFINENLFWPYFIKRYTGKEIDPEFIKTDIVQLCEKFRVRIIGADWGHGWGMNSHLINRLGRDRVMEFQYVAKLKERIRFDKLSFTFRVNRSMAISNFITSIKEQGILFPVWEEFKTFAKDILGIYVDYNERMKTMYYDHPIDQPDDAMHSLIYARLAGLISLGKY